MTRNDRKRRNAYAGRAKPRRVGGVNKGHDRKIKNIIIAIIVLVVAVCALWLVMLGVYGESRPGADSSGDTFTNAGAGDTADVPIEDATENGDTHDAANEADEANATSEPQMPPFYDERRSERYEAFAAREPHIAFDDVVWMVNVNLDKEPYEDAVEAYDPYSETALVNKFFYLPDGFSPPDLVYIGQSMLRLEAADAMDEMISAASAEGFNLWVQSGYRSFGVQAGLYNQYSARDGEAADTYSARPGHSEHQLGLAADFNTITDAFGQTPEGVWAAENCWKYGFIIRYTEANTNITMYKSEPWHVRYIGREAAGAMRDLGFLSFEEYWAKYVGFF